MSEISLRPFAWSDVPAITAIYRHYVETSTATFDTEAPGELKMAEKFGHMLEERHPIVIAERAGELVGYAYASTYRPRFAYRFTCEDSLYIRPDATGAGLGRRLLSELITQSQAFGFKQMIGVITAESAASIALHEKFGFHTVGRHTALGLKFDRWLDVVHMQKAL
ncbi:GNAT family N-acetyltransferase [Devosia sp.]|uniref:GNAT family N-acetyltransferase n=1 Tax=Devosia sp. TaxID=1871048 RepID=UPI00262A9D7D|nr:GNAT family N-acetyltransferase [Devosia sp.]